MKAHVWLLAGLLLATVIAVNVIVRQNTACRESGGVFVKTVLWYTCIGGK